jgi:uncharacterized protein with PIN domain
MTETPASRPERALEWIAHEFHYSGGAAMAEALRGNRTERESALTKMEAYACAERRRGMAGHWTYDLARHTELLRIIAHERALLAAEDLRTARRAYQAVGRQVRHHLNRHGQASISLLRRLGRARSGLVAAIAARKEGDVR